MSSVTYGLNNRSKRRKDGVPRKGGTKTVPRRQAKNGYFSFVGRTAQEYMQPIDASTRKVVNTVYDRQRSKRKASA